MKKLILFLFILICFSAIGQNPSNYQYRPVRERSVAQMFDSTATLPRYNSVPSGLRVGSSANSGHVAIDTIGNAGFFYSEGKWRAFGSQGFETRLVNGGKVTWDSLLVFSVAPAIYYINGAYYTSSQTYLTLDAANGALDRIDLIYLDSTGAHKETGVAAATPEEPSLPANSIRLTAILIPATATVPGGGVDTVTVYDENVEWTVSTTSLTALSTDNTSPFHFITDIQTGAITNTSILKFTSTTAINVSSFTALRFYLKLKGTFNNSTYLTVYFVKSGVKICIPIEIKNGTYGFSRTNTTSYQQITIPISDFGFTSTAADGLWFQPSGSNSSGFYMDWVQLQGGISQPVPQNTYTANLPIRITNNVISADTSRALAPSLATNAIVKKITDSIAALKLNITDTSNKWVNNIERVAGKDSIIFYIGSTRYAIKDSTSAGTPTLQQVLTAGSTLTTNNTISNGTNLLTISGSPTSPNKVVSITNSSTGTALSLSSSGTGTTITASNSGSGFVGAFTSTGGGLPLGLITDHSGTTQASRILQLTRSTTGTAANYIGGTVDFNIEASDGSGYISNQQVSRLQNATAATRSSQYSLTGLSNTHSDTLYQAGGYFNLTESSATIFTSQITPIDGMYGGMFVVTIEANDGTDYQARTLRFIWSAVSKAGALTITLSTPEEVVSVSAGTLTATITAVDGGGQIDFKINAVSSLTQTTLRCSYQMLKNF